MFSFLQLNLYLCLIIFLNTESEGETSRNIIYDVLYAGKRTKRGKGVKTFQQITKLSCALSCSRDESCNSFTFCGQRVCYFNSESDLSDISLVDTDNSCRLYKKAARGISKLNQALEKTSAPIYQPLSTFCFPSSKGNGLKFIDVNDFYRWYLSVNEPVRWEIARQTCEDADGVLMFSKTWSLQDSIYGVGDLMDKLGYKSERYGLAFEWAVMESCWMHMAVFDGTLL